MLLIDLIQQVTDPASNRLIAVMGTSLTITVMLASCSATLRSRKIVARQNVYRR